MKRKFLSIHNCLIFCFLTLLPCSVIAQSADLASVRLVGWRDQPFHLSIWQDGMPVDLREGFVKKEGWPPKLTFKLQNTSERIITRFTIWGQYRVGLSGPSNPGFMLEYGRGKMQVRMYESSSNDRPILPGEIVEIQLTKKAMVKGRGQFVDELEMGITNIFLDDGTRWEVFRSMRRR